MARTHAFQTTRWSLVRRAAGPDDAGAREALAELCEAYWYPLYAYFRRSGKSPHDAEDLTQGFFLRLLRRELLVAADPERGRLRTFLLACARNQMVDEHARAQADKRAEPVGFDRAMAEERYAAEPSDDLTPDRLFQRRWAMTILENALKMLETELAQAGQVEMFAALRPFLGFGPDSARRYEDLAVALQTPVGTLKNKVFRLRERWRVLLFEQVAATLDDPSPEEIKAELAELMGCI